MARRSLHEEVAATNERLERIEGLIAELVAIADMFAARGKEVIEVRLDDGDGEGPF